MKTKGWVISWFVMVAVMLIVIGGVVYHVDPYFHYHKPYVEDYYYSLDNQRSQNDGIVKHFDYNALITGTSMTENFKTTELDEIFGVNSIKVSSAGASYKEINDNLASALRYNHSLKLIVRGLDMQKFFDTPDLMRTDLGKYPTYLYDDNPFNDVKYLFNKDVIFSRVYIMIKANNTDDFQTGITSFDDYERWQNNYDFGINTVASGGVSYNGAGEAVHLSDDDKKIIYENITQNVTSLTDEYPDVEFYYFFTPYSILWYKELVENGQIYRQIEAERYIIELILEHENIKLFSFNGIENIVTDINNYKDTTHYGTWVNSYMLRCMRENRYRLTKDNYRAYLNQELDLAVSYDYNSLNEQEDYENDFYSEALINHAVWNTEPVDVLEKYADSIELSSAEIINDQYKGSYGIMCVGSLMREPDSGVDTYDYIQNFGYIGAKISIDSVGKHKYLVFYGKKVAGNAQPTVLVVDGNNNKIGRLSESCYDLDTEWHQYIVDLSNTNDNVTVYFNGGYIDNTGSMESEYIFSDIILY